ncbi:MAG: molybdopterin-guanine dinucleotide biosynthesis protein B [Deltaproteobacteria bacterium]|nr:molybdopterin-guanine dinucleotide biosynthesis protein B [Deltaproteobacteria bacterium]
MSKYPKNIISFVAKESGSGKTYTIEHVIDELKKRGLKVTAIKHAAHLEILDKKGKDTYKFAKKGADRIILYSKDALYMYELKSPDTDYIIDLASKDVDIMIMEGNKQWPFKKIEVFNSKLTSRPMCIDEPSSNFIAIISDIDMTTDIPCYEFDDIKGICDLIIETCS